MLFEVKNCTRHKCNIARIRVLIRPIVRSHNSIRGTEEFVSSPAYVHPVDEFGFSGVLVVAIKKLSRHLKDLELITQRTLWPSARVRINQTEPVCVIDNSVQRFK